MAGKQGREGKERGWERQAKARASRTVQGEASEAFTEHTWLLCEAQRRVYLACGENVGSPESHRGSDIEPQRGSHGVSVKGIHSGARLPGFLSQLCSSYAL